MRRHIALFVLAISVLGLGSGARAQTVDPGYPTPGVVPGSLPQPEASRPNNSTPSDPTSSVVPPTNGGWYDEMGNWYPPRRVLASRPRRGAKSKPGAPIAPVAKAPEVEHPAPTTPEVAETEPKDPEEQVAIAPPARPATPQKKSLRERRRQ
jgi:hypothetical protein